MKFEVSERIVTAASKSDVTRILQDQLRKVCGTVVQQGDSLAVSGIEASFGSINRKSSADIRLREQADGYLAVAEVKYTPSVWFWVFSAIGLFAAGFGFLVPLAFYLYQKKVVQSALQDVFVRVRNEFGSPTLAHTSASTPPKTQTSDLDQLEKLASLKDRGVITEEEFQAKKRTLLGM